MTEHQLKVMRVVSISAIYIQDGMEEGISISHWDTQDDETDDPQFYGVGEFSDEEYSISFSDVNFDTDIFYKLEVVDIESI